MEFDHYKDPKEAELVWEAYSRDLKRYGLIVEAVSVAERCDTADSLDIRLDMMVTAEASRNISRKRYTSSSSPIDIDAFGSWSLVVRAYEMDFP
ncbi:MAG: hypothetical protein ABII01_04110 [Candidatus Woesearchaeota archaeon]